MEVHSFFSELLHFLKYSVRGPLMKLDTGILIISIDVDVGSSRLGELNKGMNDLNVNNRFTEREIGTVEENALPLFIRTFEEFELPVTFALRGQLLDIDSAFLNLILASSVKHDIGAHGYYHKKFTNLSHNEAENELNMISTGMKRFGIIPRSFVFPKNSVAHLDLLEKYGYKCYRSYGNFVKDCMCIEKQGQLYDIHPSLYIDQGTSFTFLKKILDISIAKKLPFHVWFHLWNFGQGESIQRNIDKIFVPMLSYSKKKEESGTLTFETMLSAAEKAEKLLHL